MTDTSLMAYEEIKPKLQNKEKAVMRVYLILNIPLTDLEVATYLGWPINCVTGRRNSLVAKGELKVTGRKLQNGRTVNLYFIK